MILQYQIVLHVGSIVTLSIVCVNAICGETRIKVFLLGYFYSIVEFFLQNFNARQKTQGCDAKEICLLEVLTNKNDQLQVVLIASTELTTSTLDTIAMA